MALNFCSFCFSLPSASITDVCHHVQLSELLKMCANFQILESVYFPKGKIIKYTYIFIEIYNLHI
jgi:hypothetical protein